MEYWSIGKKKNLLMPLQHSITSMESMFVKVLDLLANLKTALGSNDGSKNLLMFLYGYLKLSHETILSD